MPQSLLQVEAIARLAGRILENWRNGQTANLQRELEQVRWLAAQPSVSSLAAERLEALSAVAESLRQNNRASAGALRVLEHLSLPPARGEAIQ